MGGRDGPGRETGDDDLDEDAAAGLGVDGGNATGDGGDGDVDPGPLPGSTRDKVGEDCGRVAVAMQGRVCKAAETIEEEEGALIACRRRSTQRNLSASPRPAHENSPCNRGPPQRNCSRDPASAEV
jgi:hypothetical protein